ncbi:hypothetical protein CGCF415_v013988 [Colletotrichum fructicola]|nr:hypothetical protein CGCSCA5_v003958 [Colletotrichum siamense]KAF4889698.1 hypothetical protein CGCF415_v013988 [Colletotrichum fructicola]KAF4898510.1 hypothetical protein CGCFRS4_v004297 [Colletotrichum fructicola]KAF4941448.1 hypothetical protein CGCF245_v001680 [Colletotrichum fructicola]
MSFHETNSSTSQFTHTNRPFRNAAFSEAAHTTKSAASFTSVWDLFSLDLVSMADCTAPGWSEMTRASDAATQARHACIVRRSGIDVDYDTRSAGPVSSAVSESFKSASTKISGSGRYPALLTSMSGDRSILEKAAATSSWFSAVSLSVDSFRPMRMSSATLASANEQAMVVPIPEPPPVNRTVLPENSSRTRVVQSSFWEICLAGKTDDVAATARRSMRPYSHSPDGNGCDVEASVVVLIIS